MPDARDLLPMLGSGWAATLRIAVAALLVYAAMLLFLRVAGKRALAKMSAHDLVVTIALGSLLSAAALQPGVAVGDALAAMAVLLVLQRVMSFIFHRSAAARRLVLSQPTLVLYDGRLLRDRMLETSVGEVEVWAAARASGHASLSTCAAIVLENDGSWSVIATEQDLADRSALADLDLPPRRAGG